RHPRKRLPFHLVTPARRPTNAPRGCLVARAAECARLRSGLPSPQECRGAPTTGRATIHEPRCLAGTTTKENRSGRPALQPRSAKSRLVGRAHSVVFTSGAAKTQPDQILVSSEPSVALASGVVPL